MGRCFVISVGGTGSRVMRALTHLKAAGVFRDNERPENDIHIMTVDSDGANAESTVRLIERYIELSDCFSVEEMSQQSWNSPRQTRNADGYLVPERWAQRV